MIERLVCLVEYVFSTPGSTAIFFSVTISSLLSVIIFIATGWRDKNKAKKELRLKKIEELFSKVHEYSRTAKKYLWSIKRLDQDVVRDRKLAEDARELIYECEIYKNLYFPDLPLNPTHQYAEMERLGGECDKIWLRVPKGLDAEVQHHLDACKLAGKEVQKLDNLLKPITEWCLNEANASR
ncbi:hypothetical protein [Bacterioplanoides sp.]|uniref:hypothetical protein n=1 Tax=Bacterioplanoides sp. TaxID=2066072 RepID=UPI003B58CBC5